jgi:dynein heavy chain
MKLNKEYINIEDIIILGCLVPPGSGRNTITSRLSRHFNVVPYTELDGSTA